MLRRRSQRIGESPSRRPLSRWPGVESLEQRTLLASAGALDTSFGGDGIVTRNFVTNEDATTNDSALQADGKIVAVGDLGQLGAGLFVARFTANGALDRS